MAAASGRLLIIKKGAAAIAGVRTKTVTMAGSPVDVTTDDDSGYRTLLATAGNVALDLSVDGVTKDDTLRAAALTNTTLELTDISIEYPDGDTITGTFFLTNWEESGSQDGATEFSCSMQSSGAWTYTPGA